MTVNTKHSTQCKERMYVKENREEKVKVLSTPKSVCRNGQFQQLWML